MEVVRGYHSLIKTLPSPVVTIGNFDGVHIGHRKIISTACEKARELGGVSVAYTFRPHPQVLLRPEAQVQLLSTYDEKLALLKSCGLDYVIEEPFSREFSSTTAETFFNEVLLKTLNTSAVVVGYDFSFGKGREGHLERLETWSKRSGISLTVVPAQRVGEEVVSSSRIRQHLTAGNVEAAARLLGRPYAYSGVVISGDKRGRLLGFPTANQAISDKLALAHGVYATVALSGGEKYLSVTNIGVRPTIAGGLPAVSETHLLDQTIDLYGTTLEVQFIARIREEKKFASLDELKTQIAADVQRARGLLSIA